MSTNQEDPYHCHCFIIHSTYFDEFRKKLVSIGFGEPLFQINNGHVYGLTKRLDKYTQIHVKVMKNGTIEAEMEYPPDYPAAHLNQEHSYSAHYEIQQIMNSFGLPYSFRTNPPLTCLQRIRKFAENPTHAAAFAGIGLAVVAAAVALYYLSKQNKESED